MAEGDTLPKLMDGKHMIGTFMSAVKDVPICRHNPKIPLTHCTTVVTVEFVLK